MPKPLLSIGMIVKDEIRCIERCLKALQPLRDAYPCELVIADTGSTDGTREVAEKYADILFDFPWVDDFSAARNAVLERCSGQWFLMVDADEYLDPDLSGFQFLFSLPTKEQPDLCAITQRNYVNRKLEHAAYSDFVATRLGRNDKGYRYQGAIHEAIPITVSKIKLCPIRQIVLHHDGYAFQSDEERRKKCRRNLVLLDKCLEETPEDERRLIQSLESARVFPARLERYVRLGMDVLEKSGRQTDPIWDGNLAARCAEAAMVADLPRAEDWLDWCLERYPKAAAVRVDLTYAAVQWYSGKKQYEKIPTLARIYLVAMAEKQAGTLPTWELVTTAFQHDRDQDCKLMQVFLSKALVELERADEALLPLAGWSFERADVLVVQNWLRVMAPLEDVPGAAEEMARALPLLEPDGDDPWRKERWREILPLLKQFFKPGWGSSEGAEHPWKLLLGCGGPLGQGARVMACTCAVQAGELLAQVEDWESFPPEALLHALVLGAGLPAGLCAQRPELRLNLLAAMARGDQDFAFHMAVYPWQRPDTLPILQAQFDLVTCAVQRIAPLKEADEAELCHALCGKLVELSRDLLPRLYHPDLLANQTDWLVLPGNHQFCLWLLAGEKKRAAGDIPGYFRDLRQGLKQAPGMKDLTEFLLDEAEREAAQASATPELLALAEQVRGILSRFPPDDPAVKELKSSPVYQRVAPLIEGIEAPVFGGLPQ